MESKNISLATHKKESLICKQGAIRAVRYNADGEYCLTCGSDGSIKLWNPHKALLLQTYSGHGSEVMEARGSHDSSRLVSGGANRVVYLWDVTSEHPIKMHRGHAGQVNCVAFNVESSVIASGSVDGTVKLWDCKSNSRDAIQTLDDAKDSVTSLSITDHEIVTSSLDSKVRRYDLRRGMLDVDDVGASVTHVAMSKDGQCMLATCLNSPVKLVDKDTGEILNFYKGHKHLKYKLEAYFVQNDSHVVCGSEDSRLYFWDLIKGTVQSTIVHETHRVVHSLSIHPTRNEILTAAEGSVYLWTSEEE